MNNMLKSVNNPKSDMIYPLCLIGTMICGVQALTNIANLVSLLYRCSSGGAADVVSAVDAVSSADVIAAQAAAAPTFSAVLVRLVLSAAAACLCVLSFRGMNHPVQKGSLIAAGVCPMLLSALLLVTLPMIFDAGTATVVVACVAAVIAAAAGVMTITDNFPIVYPMGLMAVFAVIAMMLNNVLPVTMLDGIAALLGVSAVLMASKDPKMA